MIALTWDRTWDLYIWALFTSPSGMNSALKIRRHFVPSTQFDFCPAVNRKQISGRMLGGWWSLLSLESQLQMIYLHLGVTSPQNSCETEAAGRTMDIKKTDG